MSYLEDSILKAVEDTCPSPYDVVVSLEDIYPREDLKRQLRIFLDNGILDLDRNLRLYIVGE